MSDLIIKPSGTGASLKIQNPSGTNKIVMNSSGTITTGTLGSGVTFPAGMVLQVLNSTKTDKEQISGASSTDDANFKLVSATGGSGNGTFQQAITVSGSNKVIINFTATMAHYVHGYTVMGAIFRGAAVDTAIGSCTKIGISTGQPSGQNAASFIGSQSTHWQNGAWNGALMFQDIPGAGTYYYKVGMYVEYHASTGYGFINAARNDSEQEYKAHTVSSITLMEIQV